MSDSETRLEAMLERIAAAQERQAVAAERQAKAAEKQATDNAERAALLNRLDAEHHAMRMRHDEQSMKASAASEQSHRVATEFGQLQIERLKAKP